MWDTKQISELLPFLTNQAQSILLVPQAVNPSFFFLLKWFVLFVYLLGLFLGNPLRPQGKYAQASTPAHLLRLQGKHVPMIRADSIAL